MQQASPTSMALAWRMRAVVLAGLAVAPACATAGSSREAPVSEAAVGVSTATLAAGPVLTDQFADSDPSALTDFREALAPYGAWVDDPTYGTLWVPSRAVVGASFAPYLTAGRWGLSNAEEHLWLSDHDETFGWVTFRYGRWLWAERHGWAWVPGRTYGPAWVEWRAGPPGDPVVGWGPTPPAFFWKQGQAVWASERPTPLVFCAASDLFRPSIERHILGLGDASAVAPRLVDFDARAADGLARPRFFVPGAVALPARGPSVATGHIPAEVWPRERHSRADTPNVRYASLGGMGRSARQGSAAAGGSLKTFAAGGAQVRAPSRPPQSAYLRVPLHGGGSPSEPHEHTAPTEDTAVAPTSTALVPFVIPRLNR